MKTSGLKSFTVGKNALLASLFGKKALYKHPIISDMMATIANFDVSNKTIIIIIQ